MQHAPRRPLLRVAPAAAAVAVWLGLAAFRSNPTLTARQWPVRAAESALRIALGPPAREGMQHAAPAHLKLALDTRTMQGGRAAAG